MSKLVIVPTPIGNLDDISTRAIKALAASDVVLCEDTRICSRLLRHFGIEKKMLLYRDDNEDNQVPKIISLLNSGKVVCLTSDAGTPAISDPGYRIVRACRKLGIRIEPIPGPCALTVALAASGLPSNGFLFLGFVSSKPGARIRIFQKYADFEYSLIFYESCHRILKFLNDLRSVMGPNRIVCVAREITKLYESFHVGEVDKIYCEVEKFPAKGEYVVIVAPGRFKMDSPQA
jgi:16S rRNA (cytidine1402-2'-O)-methyltransferase